MQSKTTRTGVLITVAVVAIGCAFAFQYEAKHRAHRLVPQANSAALPATRSVLVRPMALRGDIALAQQGDLDSLSEAVTTDQYLIKPVRAQRPNNEGAFHAVNSAQAMRAFFTPDRTIVTSTGEEKWQIGLRLKGYGYDNHLERVRAGEITTQGNRVEISKHAVGRLQSSSLVEWYVNQPEGLEQGFTISAPPTTHFSQHLRVQKRLRLALTITGNLRGEVTRDARAIRLKNRRGLQTASYDHLKAWDASGRELTARLRLSGREVSLEVDDAGASYPITIDPTLRQEAKLIAANGAAHDVFGTSVAISGNTAIVQSANPGGLYIFVRNGSTWTEQAQFLVPGGGPVALSGDTAIIGAPGDDNSRGAAYVFVRTGTTWTQQAKLTASDGVPNSFDGIAGDNFGWSIGISGNTAVIGAPYKNNALGAAYVFARSGETWDEETELTATEPERGDFFGGSVAISGDTIIIGVSGDNLTPETVTSEGSAYVFVKTAAWSVQEVLTAPEDDGSIQFGRAVSISGDTAIVGSDDAAYVFRRSGTWSSPQPLHTNPGEALTGEGFGDSVAISGDVAIVGALKSPCNPDDSVPCKYRGSAYVFARTDDTWSEEEKLTANDGADFDQFGYSVATSDETVIVGSPANDINANADQGSAYVFIRIHDADDDGLPDNWETNGITVDAAGAVSVGDTGNGVFIDLHAMGADPMHKDIFIHADWMRTDPSRPGSTFKPSWRAIKMVTDAFAVAPVVNPDGQPGVNLHLDLGSDSVMNPVTHEMWETYSRAGDIPFQESVGVNDIDGDYNWSEVDTLKMSHFQITRRSVVFHYALFGNTFADEPNGGISRAPPPLTSW